MRCLITGVAGFMGSHLAERLLADGHEVYGIDNFTTDYVRQVKEKNLLIPRDWANFHFNDADLLTEPLEPFLEGCDWVFHMAGRANVRGGWGKTFTRYVDCNVVATQRLLDAVLQAGKVQRFVFASAGAVYGNLPVQPLFESLAPAPTTPYGTTKLAAEQLCSLYHRVFGVPTVSLRYFTVYGPRQRPDMAISRFCRALLKGRPIQIYGDGLQRRDFTYISDAVEASILAANNKAAIGEILNIAGNSCVTVNCVIQLLEEISGIPTSRVFTESRSGEVQQSLADISRAEHILGYRPCVSLYEGLANEFMALDSAYRHLHISVA
ncbi:MAG TPA: NAD-dependent epimerase/dehydratase family protein [Ktedonobacteraceae bacterium]|nr:NAD-dependent epimerase/dehydratase family protein [Ktedonobacteraceae bacterium]